MHGVYELVYVPLFRQRHFFLMKNDIRMLVSEILTGKLSGRVYSIVQKTIAKTKFWIFFMPPGLRKVDWLWFSCGLTCSVLFLYIFSKILLSYIIQLNLFFINQIIDYPVRIRGMGKLYARYCVLDVMIHSIQQYIYIQHTMRIVGTSIPSLEISVLFLISWGWL